jgi:hypothetical protein
MLARGGGCTANDSVPRLPIPAFSVPAAQLHGFDETRLQAAGF